MRFVLAVIVAFGAGCDTKKCVEFDPGNGCDLALSCCSPGAVECEYRSREGEIYECYGVSCEDAAHRLMCDVCGPNQQEIQNCKGKNNPPDEEVEYITCADGTETACTTCERGCCDGHGGCAH